MNGEIDLRRGGRFDGLRHVGQAVTSALARLDGWSNALTGLGIYGRDKGMSHTPGAVVTIPDSILEALYYGDGIAARLVDLPVDHAMRKGYRFKPPADEDSEGTEATIQALEDLWWEVGAWRYLGLGWKWGRLFGAGYVLLGVDDGQEIDQPLRPEGVRSLDYLLDLDARDLTPKTFYGDERDPLYGQPETYTLSTTIGMVSVTRTVHESRLLRFGGTPTNQRRWRELGYRDYSVLQRGYDALRRFDNDWASASALMADSSVGVLKIKDFYRVITGGSKDDFSTRMQLVNLGLSSARIMPIDMDEDFQRIERTFSGLSQMLNQSTLFLAATYGWPVTVLFGRSPDGLNATGESDLENWNSLVHTGQTDVLVPAAERLMEIGLHVLGVDATGWGVDLPELREETDKEQADRRLIVAQADHIYIDDEVFTPEEIALCRVRDGEWSDDAPQLDAEARDARRVLLEADYDRMVKGADESEDDDPAATPPQFGGPMPPAMIAQQQAAKAVAEGTAPTTEPEPPDGDDEE